MSQGEQFIPLPDISGIGYIKEEPCQRLYLGRLIKRANYAKALAPEKRTTNDNMDIAAWSLTWRCFKRSQPDLASLLQDPFVKDLMAAFNTDEINIKL